MHAFIAHVTLPNPLPDSELVVPGAIAAFRDADWEVVTINEGGYTVNCRPVPNTGLPEESYGYKDGDTVEFCADSVLDAIKNPDFWRRSYYRRTRIAAQYGQGHRHD